MEHWGQLARDERFQELYHPDGPVGKRLTQISNLLHRAETDFVETTRLRGEHRGLSFVMEVVIQLYEAEREAAQGPISIEEKMQQRLQRAKKNTGLA